MAKLICLMSLIMYVIHVILTENGNEYIWDKKAFHRKLAEMRKLQHIIRKRREQIKGLLYICNILISTLHDVSIVSVMMISHNVSHTTCYLTIDCMNPFNVC